MGVKGLLEELPGSDMEDQRIRFSTLDILCGLAQRPANIDTSMLVLVCALRHKEAFNADNYVPAACEFQRQPIFLDLIYKWDYTLMFGGRPPTEKHHEHQWR